MTADTWMWSRAALGPFTCETPCREESLTAHLPGYTIQTVDPDPGSPPGARRIAATPAGEDAPTIDFLGHDDVPGIVSIRVREPGRIANAWHLGSRFGDTLLRPEDCFATNEIPGREADLFCKQVGEPDGPIYWFRTRISDLEGLVPDETIIRDSILYEIGWVAFGPY